MALSIYTRLGKFVKRLTGIEDLSLFRRRIYKRVGMIFHHRKYNAEELVALMQEMGMQRGSLVCIHSSMKEFYNYIGTAEELITRILDVLGPEGTLMMPAFPRKDLLTNPDYVFDATKDPTGAGHLAEVFRKFPGVKRSFEVPHSVCAVGKYAEYLVKDHHLCHDCWGEGSPWRRLCDMGGIVFNLGLNRSFMGTFHHCVESTLQFEHPYWKQFFNDTCTHRYYDPEHKVCEYTMIESKIERRTRKHRVTRFFDNSDWCIRHISNLEVKAYYLDHCFPKMLDFARKGICVYYVPNPKKFSFT